MDSTDPEHRPSSEHRPAAPSAPDALLQLLLDAPTVEAHLDEVTRIAERLSTVIDGCGITMHHGDEVMSVAVSNAFAGSVDEVQYSLGRGPCLTALDSGQVVGVDDTAAEERFGDYPEHALRHGVRSSLSVPLRVAGSTVAALNSYSQRVRGFDAGLRADLLGFASQAGAALELTLRAAAQDEVVDQLHAAMQTRSVIDQALGIVMDRRRCSAPDAFATLRAASQADHRKVDDLAVELITTTSGEPPRPGRFST